MTEAEHQQVIDEQMPKDYEELLEILDNAVK